MALTYLFGPFRLDTDSGALYRGALLTGLGPRPVALLGVLLRYAGEPVSKDMLIATAWDGVIVEESNLPVQIAALRRVLAEVPGGERWIETMPRRGYRFVGPPVVGEQDSRRGAPPGRPQEDQPSIAVLPFANLSGNSDQPFFGNAVADDIITALTRFRWFRVVARQSSFAFRDSTLDVREIADRLGVRYVLEGSHQQLGGRVRIAAQLIDAADGSHIWADRYERDRADVFAIQDDIADSVVGAIEPQLLRTESRLVAAPREKMTALDLVRRGIWHFHHVTPQMHIEARDLFRAAARLEPRLPDAHIWLARASAGLDLFGWGDDPDAVRAEGLAAALAAIDLDDKNPYAHYGLAIASCGANLLEQAERAAEKAIELSPSFALAHLVHGLATFFLGKADVAKAALQNGLRLNAHDPHNFVWFDLLALARLFTGEPAQAAEAATEALKIRPTGDLALDIMAMCCVANGRMEEARQHITAARPVSDLSLRFVARLRVRTPQWSQTMERLLGVAANPATDADLSRP